MIPKFICFFLNLNLFPNLNMQQLVVMAFEWAENQIAAGVKSGSLDL